MKIKSVIFEEFALFDNLKLDFSPYINVITGFNGVGKTIILKTLYSLLKTIEDINKELANPKVGRVSFEKAKEMLASKIIGVFMPDEGRVGRLVSRKVGRGNANVDVNFEQNRKIRMRISTQMEKSIDLIDDIRDIKSDVQALFIPPKEIISAASNFFSIYDNYHIAFEETYNDLNKLLLKPLTKGKNTKEQNIILEKFEDIIKGKVRMKDNKFYIKGKDIGEIEMGLVAEGDRKLATILHLVSNGTLGPNTILFWDEPESNLNPSRMKYISQALVELAKMGVQVFITTHSYFLLQEFSIVAQYDAKNFKIGVNFISLYEDKGSGKILSDSAPQTYELQHNSLVEEFESLYNREQEKLYDN
ncbi:MAG: AAA family ATPase [Clostridiales bacterium]|nr:AAA family ATPase [Clostridiales bacterium]